MTICDPYQPAGLAVGWSEEKSAFVRTNLSRLLRLHPSTPRELFLDRFCLRIPRLPVLPSHPLDSKDRSVLPLLHCQTDTAWPRKRPKNHDHLRVHQWCTIYRVYGAGSNIAWRSPQASIRAPETSTDNTVRIDTFLTVHHWMLPSGGSENLSSILYEGVEGSG